MPSMKKESKRKMFAVDLRRIKYTAEIPHGILKKNLPPKEAKAVKELPLNGSVYPSDAYRPAYWDECAMPSEYRPQEPQK